MFFESTIELFFTLMTLRSAASRWERPDCPRALYEHRHSTIRNNALGEYVCIFWGGYLYVLSVLFILFYDTVPVRITDIVMTFTENY